MTLLDRPFKRLVANRDKVSAGEYNRLVSIVEKLARSILAQGFTDSTGLHTRHTIIPVDTERIIRCAKIQTDGVEASSIICKLLNSEDEEEGDEITVYPLTHLGINDLDGAVWPNLIDDLIVPIFKANNDIWYMFFVFDDTTDCDE